MSYCRFSSDDWRSDVYVYEGNDGFVTHVATQRHDMTGVTMPDPDPFNPDDPEWPARFARRLVKVREIVDGCPAVVIGLEHDGATFTDATPGECARRLRGLSEMGYHVPAGAIESLEDEEAGQ